MNPIGKKLCDWYGANKRDLPWRRTGDPYAIWVSEIMLQQTRVDTVINYYRRFIRQFPDIHALAHARVEKVQKLWEGLGYYTRARNMHEAAKAVEVRFNGRFPQCYCDIRSLPGIGPYTAAAISSIAFNKPFPAVDGNVLRVISRICCIKSDIRERSTRQAVEKIVAGLIPPQKASDFCQALMELGALVCLPENPHCETCPVVRKCKAFARGKQAELPVTGKKPPQKEVKRFVAIVRENGHILMRKRDPKGLLAGLWEFPGVEAKTAKNFKKAFGKKYGIAILFGKKIMTVRHVFTHLKWDMQVYGCETKKALRNLPEHFAWIGKSELSRIAIPSAFQKIKQKLFP